MTGSTYRQHVQHAWSPICNTAASRSSCHKIFAKAFLSSKMVPRQYITRDAHKWKNDSYLECRTSDYTFFPGRVHKPDFERPLFSHVPDLQVEPRVLKA